MKDNDNRNKREDDDIAAKIIRFGAVLIAAAIIIGCFSYTKMENALGRIGLFILAGFLFAVGGFIIFVVAVGSRLERQKGNLFLYDRRRKENIPISELTVEEIRRRLVEFMSVFRYRGKLYIGDLFDEKYSTLPEEIKPLFCYELLCQICERSADAEIFLSYGTECAEIFTKYLSQSGDHEIALTIKDYILAFSEDNKNTREFLEYISSRKQYFEEKMLSYTVSNIEKFG